MNRAKPPWPIPTRLYRASRKLIGTRHVSDVLAILGESVESALAADVVLTTLLDVSQHTLRQSWHGLGDDLLDTSAAARF